MKDAVIVTERLWLRPWRLEDAEGAFRLYGDPEVMRFIGPSRVHPDAAFTRGELASILERNAKLPPGQGSFPAFLHRTDEQVATGMAKPLPDAGGRLTADVEIGWHVRRDHWGRGLATELGRALATYSFDVLGLAEVHAVVDAGNAASLAVARKLGMEERGLTTAYYGDELVHFVLRRGTSSEQRA